MIAGMTYYEFLWFFLIYSFVGWIVEVAYHGMAAGVIVNRGFLNGPVCPVYGCGVLMVLSFMGVLPGDIANQKGIVSLLIVFVIGVVFATLIELLAGWAMDKIFHARWWDYSDRPFNLNGYICLTFSIFWGMGITFVVRVWHPEVTGAVMKLLKPSFGWWLLGAFYLVFIVDVIVSAAITIGLNKKLRSLDEMRDRLRVVSDNLSERIGSDSIRAKKAIEEGQVQAALAKAELKDAGDELEKQMEKLRERLTAGQGARLLRAFPQMKHREYAETLDVLKERLQEKRRKIRDIK